MGMLGNTPRTWRFRVFEPGGALEWRTAPQWHRRQAARIGGAHSAPAVRCPALTLFGNQTTPLRPRFRHAPVSSRNYAPSPSTGQDVVRITLTLFTLLTPTRQWFKSRQGVEITETPRSWAFCNHTILQRNVFVVEDLARDAEFVSNPTVAGPPNLRFYAGAPVIDSDGFALDLFASSTTNRTRSTKARCKLCLPSRALLPTRSSCAA